MLSRSNQYSQCRRARSWSGGGGYRGSTPGPLGQRWAVPSQRRRGQRAWRAFSSVCPPVVAGGSVALGLAVLTRLHAAGLASAPSPALTLATFTLGGVAGAVARTREAGTGRQGVVGRSLRGSPAALDAGGGGGRPAQ